MGAELTSLSEAFPLWSISRCFREVDEPWVLRMVLTYG